MPSLLDVYTAAVGAQNKDCLVDTESGQTGKSALIALHGLFQLAEIVLGSVCSIARIAELTFCFHVNKDIQNAITPGLVHGSCIVLQTKTETRSYVKRDA